MHIQETNSFNLNASRTYSGFEIIKIAIEEEKDGYKFYEKMMEKSLSPGVKKVFLRLKHEEEKHLVFLKNNLLPHFEKNKVYIQDEEAVVAYLERLNKSGIFENREETENIIDKITTDLEAIRLGIDLEKNAIAFYNNFFESIAQSEGKDALQKLIVEEKRHLEILRQLQASIMNKK